MPRTGSYYLGVDLSSSSLEVASRGNIWLLLAFLVLVLPLFASYWGQFIFLYQQFIPPMFSKSINFSLMSYFLPPFCSTILKPGFHLCVGHFQVFCQCCPFRRSQVLLLMKPFLQLTYLQPGKGCSWFFPLWWGSVLIWMTNSSSCDRS